MLSFPSNLLRRKTKNTKLHLSLPHQKEKKRSQTKEIIKYTDANRQKRIHQEKNIQKIQTKKNRQTKKQKIEQTQN